MLKEIIGKCPKCGKNVFESDKSFYCEGFKDDPKCSFSLWKNNKYFAARGLTITKEMAQQFLQTGKVQINGLRSKANNVYNGIFYMETAGQFVSFHMEFAPKKSEDSSSSNQP